MLAMHIHAENMDIVPRWHGHEYPSLNLAARVKQQPYYGRYRNLVANLSDPRVPGLGKKEQRCTYHCGGASTQALRISRACHLACEAQTVTLWGMESIVAYSSHSQLVRFMPN